MKNSLWRLFVPFTIPQYHFHFAYFFVAKYIFSLTVYLTKTLILYLTSHALSVPQCRTPRVHWTLLGQCGRGTKSHWKCRMAAFILPCWNAPTLSSTAYLHSTVGQPFNYPSLLVNKSLQVSLAVSVKSLCFTELERHIWNRKTCWLMGWWMFIWLTDNRDKADRWSVATIFRDSFTIHKHCSLSLLEQKAVILSGKDKVPFSSSYPVDRNTCVLSGHTCLTLPRLFFFEAFIKMDSSTKK